MSNSQSLNQIYENCKTKKGASTTFRIKFFVRFKKDSPRFLIFLKWFMVILVVKTSREGYKISLVLSIKWTINYKNNFLLISLSRWKAFIKVHIFWEGHKILWNLRRRFVLCSASQIYGRDFAKSYSLLIFWQL